MALASAFGRLGIGGRHFCRRLRAVRFAVGVIFVLDATSPGLTGMIGVATNVSSEPGSTGRSTAPFGPAGVFFADDRLGPPTTGLRVLF